MSQWTDLGSNPVLTIGGLNPAWTTGGFESRRGWRSMDLQTKLGEWTTKHQVTTWLLVGGSIPADGPLGGEWTTKQQVAMQQVTTWGFESRLDHWRVRILSKLAKM